MSGKFSSPLAEFLYDLSLDGGHDEEAGDVDTIGHYCLFVFAPGETWEAGGENISDAAGAILSSNDQGFVDATLYYDADKLRADWQELEDDYSATFEDEE